MYLGAVVDGENINTPVDLQASPVDSSDDGVKFVTDFVAGSTSQIIVTAPNDNGYLYAYSIGIKISNLIQTKSQ